MPKKKRRDTQAKQSQRFVETARALETDESGRAFEQAMDTLLPNPKTKTAPKKSDRIVQRKRPG